MLELYMYTLPDLAQAKDWDQADAQAALDLAKEIIASDDTGSEAVAITRIKHGFDMTLIQAKSLYALALMEK